MLFALTTHVDVVPEISHAGRIREIVIYLKFHENRSRGLVAVGGRKSHSPIEKAHSYTTACTTVQAVITTSVPRGCIS